VLLLLCLCLWLCVWLFSPEHIEGVYKQDPLIANLYAHGTSVENFLVGIVVPNFELLAMWAKTQPGIDAIADKPQQLIRSDKVKHYILTQMNKKAKEEKLQG
jgi:long-chain acyl-CoA synthetase